MANCTLIALPFRFSQSRQTAGRRPVPARPHGPQPRAVGSQCEGARRLSEAGAFNLRRGSGPTGPANGAGQRSFHSPERRFAAWNADAFAAETCVHSTAP